MTPVLSGAGFEGFIPGFGPGEFVFEKATGDDGVHCGFGQANFV